MNESETARLDRLGGRELRRFWEGGLAALRNCARAVDDINVFPVPDGDTGTNMVATLAGALCDCPDGDLRTVAAAMARGALLQARGNSGVILAQILAGLASVFTGTDTGAEGWGRAWREASDAARRGVGAPVEGTILTVVDKAAEGAARTDLSLLALLQSTAAAAEAAVARTAEFLRVLERAGVVDAGGLGLALALRGGVAAFTGEPLPVPEHLPTPPARMREVIATASFARYCTELILAGLVIGRRELEQQLRRFGDSLDVTDSAEALHIHIHTDQPEALFGWAETIADVHGRTAVDMEQQRARFLARTEPLNLGWMAVAAGAGMRRIFENLPGAAGVMPDVLDEAALAHAPASQLLLLVNDRDLWTAADAVAAASPKPVRVVYTATLPEGIAAALAFDPAASLDDNVPAMLEAARSVRTVAMETPKEDIAALDGDFSLITLYYGSGATAEQARDLAARLQRRFPGVETQVIDGGQQEPPLLLAVE